MSRQRYFPESESDFQIQVKCLAADILLFISNLETDGKCTIYLAKLKQDIENKNSQVEEIKDPVPIQPGNKVAPTVQSKPVSGTQ